MHINAATLLNLVQLPLAVASLPTGSIATLGRAPSAPIALHGRKLHQVSVSSAAEPTAAVGDSAIDKILVAAGKPFKGTYDFTSGMCSGSAICVDHSLTIEAQVPGSAMLDAEGASLSAPTGGHRVFRDQVWWDGCADGADNHGRICYCELRRVQRRAGARRGRQRRRKLDGRGRHQQVDVPL